MLNQVLNQAYSVDDRDTVQQPPYRFTPTGALNRWRDNFGYEYEYQAGSDEFLIVRLPGGQASPPNRYWDVVNRRELEKQTRPQLHIYVNLQGQGGVNTRQNRYRYQNRLYTQVLTNSVRWIDTFGRNVDNGGMAGIPRVLTDNGQFIRKYYAITRLGQQYLLPFKLDNAVYARALPAVFGGNMDPIDAAAINTIQRETTEEGQNQYTVTGFASGVVHFDQSNGNELEFYICPVVLTHLAPTAIHEMAGRFTCQASDFVGVHTATTNAFQTQLLALYVAYLGTPAAPVGANIPTVAYMQQMLGLNPLLPAATPAQAAALVQWQGSSSMAALYKVVCNDVGLIAVRGSALAAPAPALGGAVNAEIRQAWLDYIAGEAAVRGSATGTAAPAVPGVSEAHRQAWLDYADGEAAIRGSATGTAAAGVALAAGRPRAHQQAWADYAAGEIAVRASAPNTAAAGVALGAGRSRGHQQAWQDYGAGETAVQASAPNTAAAGVALGAGRPRAHQLAWGDYVAGEIAVRQSPTVAPPPPADHRAHRVAWTDYTAGVTAGNNPVLVGAHRAYRDAHNDYDEGYEAGRGNGAGAGNLGYRTGYGVGASGKKQRS